MHAASRDVPVFPPRGPLFEAGLMLAAFIYFTISPLALVEFGLSYEETGGTPLEKIHPATLLASVLLLAALVVTGNPLSWLDRRLRETPGLGAYLASILLLIGHCILVVKQPFTPIIDTFLAPLIVALVYSDMHEARGRRLALLLHALMAVNAVIGIGEFATGTRLTPLVASGIVIDDDWRSSALLGHPLANASLTGAYVLILAVGGGRDLRPWLRPAAFILNLAGMVVFGGRVATVLLLALLALLLIVRAVSIARGAHFSTSSILAGLVLAPLAGLAVVVLVEAGFFTHFIERFIDDKGSAEARVEMLELIWKLPLHDLVFAPDARQVETLRFMHGLDFGIESFWVAFLLSYGAVASLIFFAALLWFCRDIVRSSRSGTILVLVFFFLVASTSVSLSAKSPLLAVQVLMLLVLMRPDPLEAPAAAPGWNGLHGDDDPSKLAEPPAYRALRVLQPINL